MSLPKPVESLWTELRSVRAEILGEADGLTQRQADWKPSEKDWSVGLQAHHDGIHLAQIREIKGAPGFPRT